MVAAFWQNFFSDDGFMPHGHCYLWNPGLVKLHVISDFLIATAYFSIPFTLLHFVRRRKDLPFNWMFICFGVFIVACGLTHVMEIWTLWRPYYWISGAVKAITAAASVPTAILLIRLIPEALRIPSPSSLQKANEALLEQTHLLNLIVSNMGDGLLVVDRNGRPLLSNGVTKRMLGFAAANDLPANCTEICGFYLPDRTTRISTADLPTGRAMRGESVDGQEIFIRPQGDGDGAVLWSDVTARPLRDENGVIQGAVAVFRDISAQKETALQQETLRDERAARIEAEAANSAKDRFLAMLGHELRTPLTPVLASVELLETEFADQGEPRSALNVIRRNVELEARLIDDILDLSAIRKGKLGLNFEVVDAHAVLQNAFSIFTPQLERKGVQTHFAFNAQRSFVRADPSRLMQIFWNLIKNAIKFTPAGGQITFSSRNEGGEIELVVADNGSGIEPDLLPRIFDSFEQGPRQMEAGFGGLGLGLTISKAIAEAQGSTLSAKSAGRGQGASFALRMATVTAAPKPAIAGKTLTAANAPGSPASKRELRILLVDDHKDTVSTLQRLLERLGYKVSSAESMAAALAICERENFDLLLTDIGLPDGTGFDLIKHIRERQPIYGIALSGFGMEEDLRKSREAGFGDYLIKPVNLDRLQNALDRFASQLG